MIQDREQEAAEYTTRRCRGCGGRYVWPKWSRRPAALCPNCQPELPLFGNVPAGQGFV